MIKFSRSIIELRAANLNEQVIITGGKFGDGSRSDNVILSSLLSRLHHKIVGLQVPQYNLASATWTEIGEMRLKLSYHATVDVNLSTFCAGRKKMEKSLAALS